MKQSVQNKINDIMAHASPIKTGEKISAEHPRSNEDSLLKAIRSPEDAVLFMAELDAVIKVSQSK